MSGMLIDDDSMAIIIARLRSDMSVTNWYGESTTAAATAQKEVSIPSITTLNTGQVIVVKPTITSTVANSTLKLNNFNAYPMRYNNADITTSSDSIVWNEKYPSQFLFNGSYWVFLGHGIDSNTTYSAMSVAEGTAGTATSSRTMRADYLKQIIETLVPLAETDPIFTASVAHGIQATDITAWNGKQDALVSGTNIKTINNESILGSGNISIGGGGTATDVKINGTSITISNEADIITEGTYDATTNKIATMSEIPTNVSDLNNDSGFITNETDPIFSASVAANISSSDVSNWNGKGTYSKPSGGIPKTDLASEVQTSLGKADTALQSFTETDPTVPSWAKEANKPSYNFSEIGNKPTTISGYGITDAKIESGTITIGSNSITPLTSFTEADPIFSASAAFGITSTNISNWNTASTNSHTHSNKTALDSVTSTKVSNWDSAYSNSHSHSNKSTLDGISSSDVSNWNGKQNPATTLSGYGITDAKIQNGTITLGSNTITPITSHQDISGKVDLSGGQMSGELTAYSQDSPNNAQVRNIHISTSEPTSADGNDGDIWIVYNM